MDKSLVPFFEPRGVVVIGASSSQEKLGYGVARNLVQSGYGGVIHFVSQKPGELFGRPVYEDLNQVPEPVELAILVVPPQMTPATLEQCGQHGIPAAIIMSSGFREVGPEGAALEQQCLRVARGQGIRLLGPNCIGVINTHLPLDTSFLQPPMPAKGTIGFISQSGAFCAAIIDWARNEGFGFSRIVSPGNQVDVSETDVLSALMEDEHTQVIALYMETVSDGRRFVEIGRQAALRKPVIALKAGRFESGQRAAASHTGALAIADTAFEAAFQKAGILRAESAEQMFDWARALDAHPGGLGPYVPGAGSHGIAILTNAGGPGVIAADALEENGLPLAQLTEATRNSLSAELPPAASIHNPVDMLASAAPDTYATCLTILLKEENVDGVLVLLPPPPMFNAEAVAERLVEVSRPLGKPVLVALMGSTLIDEARSTFQRANLPTFPFPEKAASAFGALAKRAELLDKSQLVMGDAKLSRVHRRWSNPEELLAVYDIESAPIRLARSMEEAISIASALGFPVVMKIASPDIQHKSDAGGVLLNITDVDELCIAYTQLPERVQAARPEARIEGVHIQRHVPDGQEVIVGAVRDPHFGPLMMFGSGGVEVEGLKDLAFALAPLNRAEALEMIRKTWAGRKLRGFRNIRPADEESVVAVLIKLSQLILEHESITEIEINPLRVFGKGVIAVDARVK